MCSLCESQTISDADRKARMDQHLLSEAIRGKAETWWLSFADGTRPKGDQFLGVAVVKANGLMSAIMETHVRGINPGGGISGSVVLDVPPDCLNRLMTKQELIDRELI